MIEDHYGRGGWTLAVAMKRQRKAKRKAAASPKTSKTCEKPLVRKYEMLR